MFPEQRSSTFITGDAEKDIDKDKEGEAKNGTKWKRKISRKQFRHHNIKIFVPGEHRTTTFLRQNEQSPTLSKKTYSISKESITESILNSLGSQKRSFTQTKSRLEEPVDSSNAKNNVEENNNLNITQNNNRIGKHQLPAIIMETPPPIRRSVEILQIPKASFGKNLDQTGLKKGQHSNTQITENRSSVQEHHLKSSSEEAQNGNSHADEVENTINHTFFRSNLNNFNLEKITEPVGDSMVSNKALLNEPHFLKNRGGNLQHHLDKKGFVPNEQLRKAIEPMELGFLPEQPENLSLKRPYPMEVPVDLSKKCSATQMLSKEHHKIPYRNTGNGYVEPYGKEPGRGVPYVSHSKLESNREIVKKSSLPNTTKESDYPFLNGNDTANIMVNLKCYRGRLPRGTKNALVKPVPDTAKLLSHYPKNRHPHIEPQNYLRNNNIKNITSLHMWRKILQDLLKQHFNAQLLNLMSHAYQQLVAIKDEAYVPSDVKCKVQKVLSETLNYISDNLNQFGLNMNPIDVIKILGQSDANADKHTLINNLENIQRIRMLDLNGYLPPQDPSSLHLLAPPQNKSVKDSKELPKTPYMKNFISRNQGTNVDNLVPRILSPKTGDLPRHADTRISRASEINEQLRYQRLPELTSVVHPIEIPFGCGNIAIFKGYLRELQPSSSPYMNHPVNDIARNTYVNVAGSSALHMQSSVGRARSKSHKQTEGPRHYQLRRSMSNLLDENYSLAFPYNFIPTPVFNGYSILSNAVPTNPSQNGGLSITISHQRSTVPSMCPEVYKNQVAPPIIHELVFDDYQEPISSKISSQKAQQTRNPSIPNEQSNKLNTTSHVEEKISSKTDHVKVSKISSSHRKHMDIINSRSKNFENGNRVPAVIVADTSMQITKEPPAPVPTRDSTPPAAMPVIDDEFPMDKIDDPPEKNANIAIPKRSISTSATGRKRQRKTTN